MKRWIGLAVALYPQSWRDEFGAEFRALLDDVRPSWRVFADVLRGAFEMQMTNSSSWLKVVGAMAVAGAIVGGGLSLRVAPLYEATAVVSVTPQTDPVRHTSPDVLRRHTAEHIAEIETAILSRTELSTVIHDPRLLLYRAELNTTPLENVIEQMRYNIRIQALPSTEDGLAPIVFGISFSYPDPEKAQAAVRTLASKFAEVSGNVDRNLEAAYRDFWHDVSAFQHMNPAPPPPVGDIVQIVETGHSAMESTGAQRGVFLAGGLGVGTLLGLLAALAMRWPRYARQLGGFAAAGCVLAGTASFLVPNRYTSTASMMIVPAQITEDPLAPLPAVTSAAEYLRQIEPEILSPQNLARIIQDPRLKLYIDERARLPVEEVARNMMARDLRITPMNPPSAAKGTVSAFRISFSYPNRFLAQQTVTAMILSIEQYLNSKERAKLSRMSFLQRQIHERKADEILDVLDDATLPIIPESPNRWMFIAGGLGLGLLAGAIQLRLRRPGTPAAVGMQSASGSGTDSAGHLPPTSNPLLVSLRVC